MKYTLSQPDPANPMTTTFTPLTRTLLLVTSLVVLSACGSSDSTDPDPTDEVPPVDTTEMPPVDPTENPPLGSDDGGQFAFVAARSSDYQSGRIDRISLDDGNTVDSSYPATLSDIVVTTDGENLYQIGRFNIDSITRFDAEDASVVDYQVSVNDDSGQPANPQALAFIDQTKAYLTRRGSDKLWIVNPDTPDAGNFKIGEIDLGAYDTDLPNMTNAIIVDDKLFVLVERLTELPSGSQIPERTGFVVVFDTRTDQEIETNQSPSDLKGIELLVKNPGSLHYNEDTGEIYVVGRGNYFESDQITEDFYSGGIEVIDPTTYEHSLLIDDGTNDDNEGYFFAAEVINANLGYLLTYESFGVTTLRTFNPTTGVLLDTLIDGLQDVDITVIEPGPDNHLWIGINDATPGFYRLDMATGELAEERVATSLIPSDITFIDVAADE